MPFNPDDFVNQTVDAPMSTAYQVVPEGEYRAVISTEGELQDWFREMKWKDKKTGEDRSAPTVEIPIEIIDDSVRQKLGRKTVVTRFRAVLDMDKSNKLDTSEGKNVKIGQLRKACGQNDTPGWSFQMLRGAGPFMAKVINTSDKADPEKKYSEVSRVTKLA